MTLEQCITYTPYLIVAAILVLWLLIKGYDEWDNPENDPDDCRDDDC